MSNLVDPQKIEKIVGAPRHEYFHWGRAVSKEQVLYILHSKQCVKENPDLRGCEYSVALDEGRVNLFEFRWLVDRPVVLGLVDNELMPL